MLDAIKYNLTHLFDFRAREDRPTFWWYVLFLVILDIVLGLIVSGPMIVGSISAAIHAAQSGASEDAIRAETLQQVSGQIYTMVWVSGAIKLLMIVLSVGAFVRRLHDSNNSGWWAALAIAAQVLVFAVNYTMLGTVRDTMSAAAASGEVSGLALQQSHLAWLGLLGWIAPIVIIVFGVMNSSSGPNRYGEAPQAS